MKSRFEDIAFIRDEILTSPNVESHYIWEAGKIAIEDNYLYSIMVEWMKETDNEMRSFILKDIIDYTHEILRSMNIHESN